MNPTVAGALEIQLLANLARLQQDMTQGKGIVQSSMRDISAAVEQAKGVLASLGVTATIGGLALLAKNAIDAADSMNDLSKTTGIAVEKLAGLRLASKMSGGDLDGIANSINKLSQNIGKSGEKFAALGISAKDPLEAFKQFADVFASIDDPQLRAALGAEALGKGWASAAPLLAEGGKKIGEMVEKGEKLSGITKELTEGSDAFNDKLAELAGNGGMVNGILGQMLPLLNAAADGLLALRENGGGAGSMLGTVLTEALRVVIVLAGNVGFVLRGIGTEIGGIAAQVAAFVTGDFKRAAEIGRMMTADAEAARAKFDAWEASIMAVGTAASKTAKETAGMSEEDLEAARIAKDAAEVAAKKARAFLAGAEAAGKLAKAQKDLGLADAHVIAFLKQEAELRDAVAKALADGAEARRRYIAGIENEIARQEWQNDTLGMTREQIALLVVARLEEQMAILKASGAMETEIAQLQEEIDLRKKLADTVGTGERGRAALEAQNAALREQSSLWGNIATAAGDFFADLVMNGTSAFDNLRASLKRWLAEMISAFARQFVLNIVGGSGGSFAVSAAQAAGGGASSYVNGASTLASGASLIGTGIGQTSLVQFYGGLSGAIQGPGLTGAAGLGSSLAPYAGMLGIIGAIIAAGLAAMSWYKSGWRDTNGSFSGSTLARSGGLSGIQGVDNRLLSALGFSDRDAFTMSGGPIISRLFGYTQTRNDAFGVRGTYSPGGITGENWQDQSQRGGLFSGGDRRWTNVSGFSTDQASFFDAITKGIGSMVSEAARLTGADPTRALAGYSRAFNFQLNENGTPLTDDEMAKLFSDFFGTALQEQIGLIFSDAGRGGLADYVKQLKGSGEEVTNLIAELLGVMGALDQANILGMSVEDLMQFKVEGESLAQTFERISGQWNQFQSLYVSDAERLDAAQASLLESFKALGVEMPASNAEFRKLVEGIDVSTEAGRKMFEAMMALAPAFAGVSSASAQLLAQFRQIAAARNPALGRSFLEQDLRGTVEEFMARNPWTNGMAWQEVARQINLITSYEGGAGDFGRYSAQDRALILRILGITDDLNGLGDAAQEAARGLAGVGNTAQAAADWLGIKGSLWDYLRGLYTDRALSPLPADQQLETLKARFSTTLAQAQGGNIGAGQSLQGIIDQVLKLGRSLYGSTAAYDDLFKWITGQAADFVMPGGAAELQRLAYEEAKMSNANLLAINDVLIQIRDNAWAAADAVVKATEDSGEKAARAARSRVAVR